MEPVPALAVIVGLVGSLDTTLHTLQDFTYRYSSYTHAEDLLRNLYQHLIQVQSSLNANLKHAQVEKLLDALQDIEQDLDKLQETVQDVDKYRKIRLLRCIPWRRDMEAAMTSILLAKDMIQMIRTVKGRGHGEKMLMESVSPHNQAPLEWLTRNLKPKDHWRLLNAPNTKAQEMFAWIACPEGQDKIHEQCRAERIPGTCEWFLAREEFKSWLQRPSRTGDESIFWCKGRPGIGKTMLASKIIDQLKPLHTVAYFYMSSGNLHSASDVVTSLLKQLCLPFNIVPDRLKQIFEQKKGEPDYRLQLGDLLKALRETSCSIHQPITIVVDGLDKSNIREHDDFVQVFDSLKDTSWKCLITSRDNCQDTCSSLPRAHDRFSEFTIGDHENERDIYNFVDGALKENEPVDKMLDSDPELRSELIETLTSRAHGMFFWATLQVRLILDQTHLSGIRNALRSIPGDIREIVKVTFRMVKLQDEKRAELAIRALALLTAAQAPLTAEAMCHFLGLAHILDYKERPSELILEEIPNPESITDCCMGLIKVEPTTKIVMLAHYDILQEMRKQWDEYFAKEHSARLAITCIAYLSLAEVSKGPCHDSPTFRSRLEKYPFLDYASHYWGYHARAALSFGSRKAEISDDINRFLKQPMNLALSLQVSEHNPKGKRKALAMHPDQLPGVSELQIASRHGLATLVQRFLLDMSLDMISKQDSYGRTALHEAAQAGWEDIVGMLIKAKADPSTMDYEGKTPFIYAAERRHTKLLSVLDDSQVRSSHDQEKLEDALCEAAEAARTGIVKELLQLGVNPNSERYKTSPMTIASRRGHIGIVRLLLKAGASPSTAELSSSDRIPLHQAIRNNHVDVAALLLSYGADIEARDSLGRTAIFETLDTPDVRGAALLLKNGIDISCLDDMGDNLLHEAARTGAFEHASSFVDRGIAMSIPNKKGLTPLHLAARHGHSAGDGSYEIASLLVREGATINHRDCTGQTPLMYAVSAGNPQLCRMLLEHGASVDTMEVIPEIPPSSAEETGDHRTLQSTVDYSSNINVGTPPLADQSESAGLEQGADIQERGSSSKITPLILAAKAGHTDILQLLLDCGRGANGSKEALIFAAEAGHVEAVRLLLNFNRARFDEVDKDLETATVAAGKAGHQEILELLFQAREG